MQAVPCLIWSVLMKTARCVFLFLVSFGAGCSMYILVSLVQAARCPGEFWCMQATFLVRFSAGISCFSVGFCVGRSMYFLVSFFLRAGTSSFPVRFDAGSNTSLAYTVCFVFYLLASRSGELRTQILKSHLVRTRS